MGSLVYFLLWGAAIFLVMRFGCGRHIMGHGHSHTDAPSEQKSPTINPILQGGSARSTEPTYLIPVLALGFASSCFLAISYVLCVLSFVLFPALPIAHGALLLVLPGFTLLSIKSFFLGLTESFAWGWYISLIFAPLYNYFAIRFNRGRV